MSDRARGYLVDSPLRTISEIVKDGANTHENRALECLVALDRLTVDDLAREDFRTAAQTFALLALVDRIGYTQTGEGLAEVVRRLGS